MYSFPRAAVTESYKLGGQKQQKCILSQLVVQKAKNKELAALVPSGGSEGVCPHLSPKRWERPLSLVLLAWQMPHCNPGLCHHTAFSPLSACPMSKFTSNLKKNLLLDLRERGREEER